MGESLSNPESSTPLPCGALAGRLAVGGFANRTDGTVFVVLADELLVLEQEDLHEAVYDVRLVDGAVAEDDAVDDRGEIVRARRRKSRSAHAEPPPLSPVVPGLRPVQRSATICKLMLRKISSAWRMSIFSSKFNVALGIEAEGFCVIK